MSENCRPNIIVITTDQQRIDTMGCYGAEYMHTPNLDKLAEQGAIFQRAYCANPVCTPARASIFSGRQVSRHGVWNVGINIPHEEQFVSHIVAENGYRTHYIGKTHFNTWGGSFEESVESFDDWDRRFPAFTGPYYGFQTVEMSMGHNLYGFKGHYGCWVLEQVGRELFNSYHARKGEVEHEFHGNACDTDLPMYLHQSVWATDRAINFLQQCEADTPFLLAIGYHDPHHPHALPEEFSDRVDAEKVPLPDWTEGELADKPPHFLEMRNGTITNSVWRGRFDVAGQAPGFDYREVTEEEARRGRAYYYSEIQLLDKEIGRLMEELKNLGQQENTLIIFTTDHGEMLGDHGIWAKGPLLFEQAVNVPLIISWPSAIAAGQEIKALFSHVDIVPTLLAAVGVPAPENIDGYNALPLLQGGSDTIRDAVLIEHVDDPETLRMKSVVTDNHKLVYYAGQSFGELYDLENDPREKINHWDNPDYTLIKAALFQRLLDFLEPVEKREARNYYV